MILVSFIVAAVLALPSGDVSLPVSGQVLRRLSEAPQRAPVSLPQKPPSWDERALDPLCRSGVLNLGRADASTRATNVLADTLTAVPARVVPELLDAEREAREWFEYITKTERIPGDFIVEGLNQGHSYADLNSQSMVLSSPVRQRQLRIARSMLLRLIHLWDDFVDRVERAEKLRPDLHRSAEDLMRGHEERIFQVWRRIKDVLRERLPGVEFNVEPFLFGIQRTAYASLMFSKHVPNRQELRSTYKLQLLRRLPERSRVRRFIAGLNETYVAYTAKVLLEAFDGPFQSTYPRDVRYHFRGLSYVMELLYVPALVKQNEAEEINSGEITRRSRLDEATAGENLEKVMNWIKTLPEVQRRFVVRNLPLFLEKYEAILKRKLVVIDGRRVKLFDVYQDFMTNNAIAPFVTQDVIYQAYFRGR